MQTILSLLSTKPTGNHTSLLSHEDTFWNKYVELIQNPLQEKAACSHVVNVVKALPHYITMTREWSSLLILAVEYGRPLVCEKILAYDSGEVLRNVQRADGRNTTATATLINLLREALTTWEGQFDVKNYNALKSGPPTPLLQIAPVFMKRIASENRSFVELQSLIEKSAQLSEQHQIMFSKVSPTAVARVWTAIFGGQEAISAFTSLESKQELNC